MAPDGVVDVHDLLKTLSGYSRAHAKNPEADVDRSADVDAHDVLFVLKHFDKECMKQKRGFFG